MTNKTVGNAKCFPLNLLLDGPGEPYFEVVDRTLELVVGFVAPRFCDPVLFPDAVLLAARAAEPSCVK
jgi:hypothetical protein